jgi:hypothetical protein
VIITDPSVVAPFVNKKFVHADDRSPNPAKIISIIPVIINDFLIV